MGQSNVRHTIMWHRIKDNIHTWQANVLNLTINEGRGLMSQTGWLVACPIMGRFLAKATSKYSINDAGY